MHLVKNKMPLPIEWATWGQILGEIGNKLSNIRQKPDGPQKSNALAFYDTIVSDLRTIKSLYRDETMHFRDTYDEGEAQTAMFRAKQLMITLSTKLDETSTRAIPWSAWK